MRIFHCDHCDHLIFFENHSCVSCGRQLAYLPDIAEIGSLDPGAPGTWVSPLAGASPAGYRLCANYTTHNVCNWAIPADDPAELCSSCRLTRAIPDPSILWQREAWYKLEVAKRRLVYSLLQLRLPVANRVDDPQHGLAFEFLADQPQAGGPVLTGHLGGVITINLAEADDAERERRRLQLHEPYRTLLGHVRHEVGHYYWERLIAGTRLLGPFRALFGDERADYGGALQTHYVSGPPGDWQSRFISSYATAHPWEDWAESWAHYLHMTDTLETAAARRTGPATRPGGCRLARRGLRPAARQLVPADLRPQQPQSRPRRPRRLSVRDLAAGDREAPLHPRGDRRSRRRACRRGADSHRCVRGHMIG